VGELAFWLIFLGFHGTFLADALGGPSGPAPPHPHLRRGDGWGPINLFSSISGFVMGIGFAIVVVDIMSPCDPGDPRIAKSVEGRHPGMGHADAAARL
jgi:heme/copper-type cytochrome/quinol oxidase subunit 1